MNKYLSRANKRDQESYSILYGRGSLYLDRHKQYSLFLDQNRKDLSEDEIFLLEYSLGVRDILGLFDKPYIETCTSKSSRFQVFSGNKRTSFLDFEKRKVDPLPKWEYQYDIDNELRLFNDQKKITLDVVSNKYDLIIQALKIFPNSFLITFDTELIKYLKSSNIELGIICKKERYTCPIKDNKINKAPCASLFGNEKLDYLSNNECYLKCRYIRDLQNSRNFKISAMRPYTFLSQLLKGNYTPRCLMILDKGFFNSLKSYFAFTTPVNTEKVEYFKFVKNCLDNKVFELKNYEKKGWLNLIEQLRQISPRDERFPSFNTNLYKNESKEALFHYLKKKGSESIEGLTTEDFSKYCELKIDIFKMNLALRSKEPYFVKCGIHTPHATDHIWRKLISKYAKYFLILNV